MSDLRECSQNGDSKKLMKFWYSLKFNVSPNLSQIYWLIFFVNIPLIKKGFFILWRESTRRLNINFHFNFALPRQLIHNFLVSAPTLWDLSNFFFSCLSCDKSEHNLIASIRCRDDDKPREKLSFQNGYGFIKKSFGFLFKLL